ncbi:hypothetical protein WKI65_44285 [Streptomyces sp. MS1.AVA.3]|uniref:hypothetical protein n=1 Tax=Streptomyces decoyicus TaxID=249567 RepID=UPI0030BC9309
MTTLTLVTRSAASDRSSYERAFTALEAAGCKPRARGESGLDACCPSHDDTDASLSGDWKPGTAERSGAMMLKCHAASGCTFDTILAALDLPRSAMFDGLSPDFEQARRSGATPSPRRTPSSRKATPAKPRRTSEPKPKADHDHDFKHERTHTYSDTIGTIVARIHRKRCAVDGCNEKTFRTAYPNGKPADGVPLYGTPELAAAIEAGRTIHICEGEGDQEALTEAGEVAVSAPFGADSGTGDKWLPMHTEQLRGARAVVIWADRDAAGLMHAGYIANQLLTSGGVLHAEPTPDGYGITIDLRIVYPAVETPKADASDHFAAGHSVADAVDVPAEDLASTGLTGPATRAIPDPQETQPPAADPTQEPAATDTDQQEEDRDAPEPGQTPPPGFAVEGSSGWRYSTTAGRDGTMWKSSGRGENRTWSKELSWAPILEERLVLMKDDGKPGAKYFTFRVGADTATVSLADLRTGEAWDAFPDAVGTGSKPVREALLNCVETQGKKMPRIPVVTRTGWHTLPDVGRTYVFADGRTFPEGRYVQVIGAPEPLRRAAEPLNRTADDTECRTAIGSIAAHGWASFMGLGAGARSLGYTLRPVPSSLVFDAEPNSGKTQAANTGRSLILTPRPKAWPPVVTKGMNSTITDIECAIDFEADTPSLLDDVALTRASPAIEVREMEKKLELVLRAGGNLTEIRGRRNRDLTSKPGNYIRSIPVVAAQMLPISMQESLYRRSVVIYLSREGGEVDWRWYRDGGGAALSVPLRTLGDRIIAHLHGLEDPDAYLADLETQALKRFTPYIEAELPESSGTMDGVVTAAAAMLAGFGLLAAVTGLEMDDMIDVVAAPLAASLARQARVMDDQHVAQDDLSTAVVEVIRQALSTGRAHVRDAKGVIGPAVPGEVEQVQGVVKMKDGSDNWEGKGPAFYWLPERGPAFGVRTIELHTLLKASSDTRVQGIGQRTLPDTLLKAGLTIRNDDQKARVAVHQVRVGEGNPRLLLIKAELVWDLPESGDPDPGPEGGNGGGGDDGDGQPSGTEPSVTAPKDQITAKTLFDVIAEKNGDIAPANSPSPNDDSLVPEPSDTDGYSSEEEDEAMAAIINDVPKGTCVRCGHPTTGRNADGQWMHTELPGLYRCDQGYTNSQFAHLNPVVAPHLTQQPAPAAPPATPSIPTQAAAPEPTPSPRPEVQPAAPVPPRQQPTPATTDATFPNGPLAVLDLTDDGQIRAHLVDGRTLDCPARSIPTLIKWALDAGLGQRRLHKWGNDADPLVILTAAVTKKMGLPADLEDRDGLRLEPGHKVIKALAKAGWTLTKRGFGPWPRIYKPVQDGRRICVQLAIVPWGALDAASGWYMDDDTAPADIARALGTYADRVIAPRGTMATSGLELMLQLRPATRPVKVETTDETTGEVTETYVSGSVEGSLTQPRSRPRARPATNTPSSTSSTATTGPPTA